MTIVYGTIFVVVVLTALWRQKDPFSPFRLYLLVYAFLLGLVSLKLSRFQTSWCAMSHLLFWGAHFMFLAGSASVFLFYSSKNYPRFNYENLRNRFRLDATVVDWGWFMVVWKVCAVGFVSIFLLNVVKTGIIPAFASDPDAARIKFLEDNQIISFGWFLGPLSLMLASEALLFGHYVLKQKVVLVAGAGIVLLLYLTLVTRFDLLRAVFFAIILFHYGKRNIGLKLGTILLVFCSVIFLGMFLVRIHLDAMGAFNDMLRVRLPARFAWLSNPYAYACGPFWNFDFAIKKFVLGNQFYPVEWGSNLFSSFLWWTRTQGPIVMSNGFDTIYNESVCKVPGLNTIVYVWHLYKDFRTAGVFFGAFGLGLLFTFVYQLTISKGTLFILALWALLAPCIMFSFHTPLWQHWFLHFNIVVVAVAHKKFVLSARSGAIEHPL